MPVTFSYPGIYVEEIRSDTLRTARLAFAPHSRRRRSQQHILAAARRMRFALLHGKAARDDHHRSATATKVGGVAASPRDG
jgi:hypothetical protein